MAKASPKRASWAFEDSPDLYGLFNAYYGELWTYGVLDQATKEVGRLRSARINDCAI
jgi:hypothetical protein